MNNVASTNDGAEEQPAAGFPNTPVLNPLDPSARQLVAAWLAGVARTLSDALAGGPSEDELTEFAIDRDEWVQRARSGIARLRADAARIVEDQLQFLTAADVRNLLDEANQHALTGAGAALDAAIAAVIPQRAAVFERLVEEQKKRHGFYVQGVGGRGAPLPLPPFTYTEGLAEHAGHPELVIVSFAGGVAGAVLNELGRSILSGTRRLAAGDELDGLLANGYKLRVVPCPPALLAQTHPDPEHTAGALQIVLPD